MSKQEYNALKVGDRVLWVGPDAEAEAIAATVTHIGLNSERKLIRWDDGMVASVYPVPEILDTLAVL